MQCGLACHKSIRLSVKHVNCGKTKENYAHILVRYERVLHLVLSLLPEILGQIDLPPFQNGSFLSILARSATAITLSEKSLLVHYALSLSLRRTAFVAVSPANWGLRK